MYKKKCHVCKLGMFNDLHLYNIKCMHIYINSAPLSPQHHNFVKFGNVMD
jgi:hypothetical protein